MSDHIPKNIPADLNTSINVTGDSFSSEKGKRGDGVLLMTAACSAYLALSRRWR